MRPSRGSYPSIRGNSLTELEEMGPVLLDRKEPFYVMIRDKNETVEKELLATGRLYVVVKQMMGSDRALVLFSNRPAAQVIMLGDPFERGPEAKQAKIRRVLPLTARPLVS